MAKIYRCDKCLKEFEGSELTQRTFNDKDYALCVKCSGKLDIILDKINKDLNKKVGEFLNVNTDDGTKEE